MTLIIHSHISDYPSSVFETNLQWEKVTHIPSETTSKIINDTQQEQNNSETVLNGSHSQTHVWCVMWKDDVEDGEEIEGRGICFRAHIKRRGTLLTLYLWLLFTLVISVLRELVRGLRFCVFCLFFVRFCGFRGFFERFLCGFAVLIVACGLRFLTKIWCGFSLLG